VQAENKKQPLLTDLTDNTSTPARCRSYGSLYWLLVSQWITFSLALPAYSCLHGTDSLRQPINWSAADLQSLLMAATLLTSPFRGRWVNAPPIATLQ